MKYVRFLLKKSIYSALGTKSMEDILEGLRDEEDRMLSLNPTLNNLPHILIHLV